jgi:hypothetical protein
MEGAGENPYLGSKIAEACVKGFQEDLNSNKNILACSKHFAAYAFAGRDYNTADVQSNETKKVTFTINEKTIEFFTVNLKWKPKQEILKSFVGGNSVDTLKSDFQFVK